MDFNKIFKEGGGMLLFFLLLGISYLSFQEEHEALEAVKKKFEGGEGTHSGDAIPLEGNKAVIDALM
jgi:hypothetical protein